MIFYILYHLLLWLLMPLLILYVIFDSLFSLKKMKAYMQRFSLILPKVNHDKSVIWIHGVSAGEIASITKFVSVIKKNHHVFITTSTDSGMTMAQKLFPEARFAYFPYDYICFCKRFFTRLKPSCVIFIEGEIWPNFLNEAEKKEIPCFLISGRMGEKEFNGYKLLLLFFKKVFNKFQFVSMQSETDCQRMKALGVCESKIYLGGSLKGDLNLTDSFINKRKKLDLLLKQNNSIRLIAASTHETEEAIYLDLFAKLRRQYSNLKLIIAPRHPQRAEKVTDLIRQMGMSVQQWSQLKKQQIPFFSDTGDEWLKKLMTKDILLVDTIGDLLHFYLISQIVFLGGSFCPKVGGHNLLEPACLEKPIILGPYTHTIQWLVEDFIANEALMQVQAGSINISKNLTRKWLDELYTMTVNLITDQTLRQNIGDRAQKLVLKHQGASKRNWQWIESHDLFDNTETNK